MNFSSSLGADGARSLTVLSEDGERVLCRGWRDEGNDDRTAVLAVLSASEQPTPGFVDRVAHEYGLRDELDGRSAARPLALVREHGRTTLFLEDPGGETLDRLLGSPMEIGRFLRFASGLSAALRRLHERGLIHKDIKPANILVDSATGQSWLTGFGIASRLPRERQPPEPPELVAGTLAYMAPEQTGRMNRSIDSRSDLYSLGVTFYEMLTGALPFTASDPMEWVHCHIARQPVPPAERLKNVPLPVSAIISKLLAKTAEERYQTAAGVEADLHQCLTEWESRGRIDAFSLGSRDVSDRLLIPEKLYGREREIESLLAAFDRVVTGGRPELMLVSGYSGIGKSAVVNELHKVLVPQRGLFASGKFDQYKRDIPYATLAQAFQSLIRSLLGKSDAELAVWRNTLRDALGPNGRLVIDVVPELKLLIGEQPPVQELPPQQAQARLQLVFRRFLGVFARPEHPLVLFLDDLQWLDAATLDMLADLLTQADVQHLLVIGAYRDNEVNEAHPLMRKLQAIRKAGSRVQEIVFAPLTGADLGQLIADSLRCELKHAAPLAQLVHKKTVGNPFFAIQFVFALAEEKLLAFDATARAWRWNVNRIHAKGYTDNVVDLMAAKLKRLSVATQEALKQLACLGNVAPTSNLALVNGTTEEAMHAVLSEAVHAGLVFREDAIYKFLHDRIQQAAYSLIPDEQRAKVHQRIGRALLAGMTADELTEYLFDVANQFNRGSAMFTEQEERERIAEVNLAAGMRAKAATAYASALAYFTAGHALMSDDGSDRQYALTFSLGIQRAECEFLNGQLTTAERRLAMLSQRAANLIDKAAVAYLRMSLYMNAGQADRAVEVSLEYLRAVGVQWSAHPAKEDLRQEYEQLWRRIGGRSIEQLLDLPLMTDAVSRATLEVLTAAQPPAHATDMNLYCLVAGRMANLSLEHGNSDGSGFAYVMLGETLGPQFGDYRAGLRFGRLGIELVEKHKLDRFKARVFANFGGFIVPWSAHIRSGRAAVRLAFDTANQTGDLTIAGYCCNILVTNLLGAGDPLDDVQREAESGLALAQKMQFDFVADIISTQLALIKTLRGLTPDFGSLNDPAFDEDRFEKHFSSDRGLAIGACWYWIRRMQARFYAGDYSGAIAAAVNIEPLLWTSSFCFEAAEFHFYGALTRAAHCDSVSPDERPTQLEALSSHYKQLEIWANNCPENFVDRATLIAAEVARVERRDSDAMRLYEQAIQSARENGFVQNEGVAYEVAARFYAARGFETIATAYLRSARHCYLRWGADGKVRQLDRLHPHLAAAEWIRPTAITDSQVKQLDVASVVKASQAVSSEIVLSKLTERLMTIAIENAGADRGLLILPADDDHLIQAEAKATGDQVEVALGQKSITGIACPESIVRYVIRTHESVILDDASRPNLFSDDDYLRGRRAKSILCLPLIKQGRLAGLLYLENTLTSHAFAADRIAILELLAAQAAISLENTRLYSDLQEREAKVRRLIDSNIIGVFIWDIEGRIIEANEAFLHILGHSRDDLLSGRVRWTELTPAEWRDTTEQTVAALRATGTSKVYEKEFFRKDCTRVPVLIGAATFGEGRDQGVAFVLDLTERKRAEAEAREREAKVRRLIDSNIIGIFIWDFEGRILEANDAFLQMLRYGRDDLAAGRIRWTDLTPPEWRELDVRLVEEHKTSGRLPPFEKEYFRNDGNRVPVLIGVATFEEGGDQGVAFVLDLTERKRAEAEARESERRYREAQAELARATRLTTLGELTASIAHEVNQPLAALLANTEACLQWIDRETPNLDAARRSLEWVIKDGNRAADVIRRVRTLLKKSDAEKAPLNINEVINDSIALVQRGLLSHRVSLRMELAPALPSVPADRVQLQQVIINLVVNGIEAMQSVTDRPRELTIRTRQDEERHVLVTVKDCGIGISAADADRLFNSFFTTKSSGMGMGLSICRSIIEAHGGRVWAEPNLPHGANFHFTVPSHQEHAS